MSGTILIISGPSGSGKSTLMAEVIKSEPNIWFSISTTTREIRDGEEDGVDYYFVSKEEFEKGIDNDGFLEWARVHGNYYGTAIKPIKKALREDKIVMFDIDVQGHKIIRDKIDDIVTSVFITTPTDKILKQRLIDRATDTLQSIKKRIANAKDEMKRISEYDYLLINDDFQSTLKDFIHILKASRKKNSNSEIKKFVSSWSKKE